MHVYIFFANLHHRRMYERMDGQTDGPHENVMHSALPTCGRWRHQNFATG